MTETKISTISKIYAKALVDTAVEMNASDTFKSQLNEIQEILKSSDELRMVMSNPSIPSAKKIQILENIFKDKYDRKILNLLNLLTEKNRFDEYEAVVAAFIDYTDKISNKKNVEIVSSIPLNFEMKSNILFKLEHKLQCEIIPHWSVDENIIAGLQFKFDDYIIDTSIRNKIENLSKNITR